MAVASMPIRRILAIERAKRFLGQVTPNVQPHSGAQANMACFSRWLQPGDTDPGNESPHGGHLTHGHPAQLLGSLRYRHAGNRHNSAFRDTPPAYLLVKTEPIASRTAGSRGSPTR